MEILDKKKTNYRGILNVQIYKISGEELYKIFHPTKTTQIRQDNFPGYSIEKDGLKDFGYHQFIMPYDKGEYFFIDFNSSDEFVNEEIGNSGYEDFFKEIDIYKFTKDSRVNDYNKNYLAQSIPFVIEFNYYSCMTDCGEENDADIKIVGYLDECCELINIAY